MIVVVWIVAIASAGMTIYDVRTGRSGRPFIYADRATNPWLYWFNIALEASISAALIWLIAFHGSEISN